MPSPDRFRKLDGLGWLTTAAAAVAGGCAWLFSPFLVSPFLQDFTFHGKLGPAWLTWVLVLSAFGASILLHEAGHCLAARYLGLPISQIRVSILRGTGSVEIDAELDRREEMWVTLAGPLRISLVSS